MKNAIPQVGSRFCYSFRSVGDVPDFVPDRAIEHKLEKDRNFEVELFTQSEMREMKNDFRRKLKRRGVDISRRDSEEYFTEIMKRAAHDIDLDFEKKGVGHIVGQDRHFGDGRDSEEWFFVLDWPTGAELRKRLGYSPADFHIVIGLTGNGVTESFARDDSTIIDREEADTSSKLSDLFNTGR